MQQEQVMEIVLVEDNPADAELTLDALETSRLCNRVTVIRDGQEALDFFFGTEKYAGSDTDRRPCVVLLDLKLPKVDGLDVLRALRADERTRDLPVVVLVASKEYRDLVRSYDLRVDSTIVKPVEFEKLAEAAAEIGLCWVLLKAPPF